MRILLTVFINLFILGALFCQSEWTFYNGNAALLKEEGGTVDLQNKLRQLHVYEKGDATGSVYVLRRQQSNFVDRIAMIYNGFLLVVFKNSGASFQWVLIKVQSKPWLDLIHSIVPENSQLPLSTPSKRNTLTTIENEALSTLTDKVKSIYCKATDAVSDSIISILRSSQAINIDELKKLSRIDDIKKMSDERQKRLANGVPRTLRLTVYNNKIYMIDPKDGFIYFEIKIPVISLFFEEFKNRIMAQQGIDIINECENAVGCVYTDKGISIAEVIPSNLARLPKEVEKKFRVSHASGKEDDNTTKRGMEVSSNGMSSLSVVACPPILSLSNVEFPGLNTIDANTYLVSASENSGLTDWFLFTGKSCFKCGGINESMIAEVFSPKSTKSIKILKTSNLKTLTANVESPEKTRLISGLIKSFKLAEKGLLLNNTVDYLGEGGLVYQKAYGRKAITVDNTTMTYDGRNINTIAFNEWLGYFDRIKRKVSANNSIEIVNQLFEIAASGKVNWYKEYRQNPLVFLSKYCQIERL
jgi:hypothetical protein